MDPVGAAAVLIFALAIYGAVGVVLLRQHGRLLVRVESLETRVRQAGLMPRRKKGDAVPSLELTNLDGELVNLADLRGRRRLLLFWDAGNYKCQAMVPDLNALKRTPLAGSPEVVIVASGSEAAARAVSFDWPVLLDPAAKARASFGADTAPAAALIDDEGRLQDDVQVGYLQSFQLTGWAPYVPTEPETVEAMLTLAEVTRDDVVYDIGCGDGRIVVMAATKFGARGVGVDINPDRLAEARANAKSAGVEHLVRFDQREFMDVDLRPATVLMLYLMPDMVNQLRPKLQAELRPGARVVSHDYDFDDWKADGHVTVGWDEVFLWRV